MANGLTDKQQIFIDEYLKCFNATEAARRAGYSGTDNTLAVVGHENLRKPNIKEHIDQRLQESAMLADEALMRLARQARGDIGDFAMVESGSDLAEHPQSDIVKRFKKRIYRPKNSDPYEEVELEIYDAHAPLVDIIKVYGLFTDKIEHTGRVEITGLDEAIQKAWDDNSD